MAVCRQGRDDCMQLNPKPIRTSFLECSTKINTYIILYCSQLYGIYAVVTKKDVGMGLRTFNV